MVVQEVRRRTARTDVLLGQGVEVLGRDPGSDGLAHDLERLADDETRLPHESDLFGSLDLDPAFAEHQASARASTAASSAAMARSVISSTAPWAVMERSSPAFS